MNEIGGHATSRMNFILHALSNSVALTSPQKQSTVLKQSRPRDEFTHHGVEVVIGNIDDQWWRIQEDGRTLLVYERSINSRQQT